MLLLNLGVNGVNVESAPRFLVVDVVTSRQVVVGNLGYCWECSDFKIRFCFVSLILSCKWPGTADN